MRISKKIATAAAALALAAGLLAPTAAAACPYTVGPLGRYIAPAIVKGMTATDENQIEVWCSDALDGDDWYFLVDAETDLRIFDRVPLAPFRRVNFAVCRRGQILHLTAYRPIGNGELGSMPPYYPPLAPFFPGFRRGESITGHSFGASLQDIGLHTLSSRRRCCPDFSAPIFRGSNLD